MNDKVGIWIDHRKAVIVSASADRISAKTLESRSDALFRSGRVPGARELPGRGSEKKYEEAKLQLKERLSRSRCCLECIVGIETTDKLRDPQIAAKVKKHYGLDR
jgi:hypothetical protein